jgi:hypothetical protein
MGTAHSRVWTRSAGLIGLLIVSWPIMLTTHELGHLFGGWMSGGVLKDYELRPWRLPYSIFDPDPHPLVTLWCGPILGVLLPVCSALMLRRRWAWFIADFCVLANGLYLAGAWLSGEPFLDTTQLLTKGAFPASIVVYCALTIGIGYWRFRRDCMEVFVIRGDKSQTPTANT